MRLFGFERGAELRVDNRAGRGVSILISRLAAAGVYVRLCQRAVQLAIFQLATAGVYLFARECTDKAGLR